jgi:hypothetical protein
VFLATRFSSILITFHTFICYVILFYDLSLLGCIFSIECYICLVSWVNKSLFTSSVLIICSRLYGISFRFLSLISFSMIGVFCLFVCSFVLFVCLSCWFDYLHDFWWIDILFCCFYWFIYFCKSLFNVLFLNDIRIIWTPISVLSGLCSCYLIKTNK